MGTSWLSGNLPFSPFASFPLPGRQLRVVICAKNQDVRYGRSGAGDLDLTQVCLGVGLGEGAVRRQFFLRASFLVALILCDPFLLAASLFPLFWNGLGFFFLLLSLPSVCVTSGPHNHRETFMHSHLGSTFACKRSFFQGLSFKLLSLGVGVGARACQPSLPLTLDSLVGPALEDVRGCLTSMWGGGGGSVIRTQRFALCDSGYL